MTSLQNKFANNAITTLAAGITASSPSLQVVSGGGALFPTLGSTDAFTCTLIKNGSPNIFEIIQVRGRSGDNFTGLQRGIEDTAAQSWNAGDTVALLPTAGVLSAFLQSVFAQSQSLNYAIDVGSANAYSVSLTPPLNGHVIGMPIRFLANNACTGDSTFNDGVGAAPIRVWTRPFGHSALYPNEITAGKIYTVFWDGTYFQLDVLRMYFDLISGAIANSQVPFSAVAQWESLLAIAFSQLTGQLQNGQIASSIALPGSPTTTTQSAGDSSTKIATTAFANPGVTVSGSSVCIRLPSGHKIQLLTANPNGGSQAVTYPVAFTSYAYPVVSGLAGGNVQNWLVNGTQSLTGVTIANTGGSSFLIAIGL